MNNEPTLEELGKLVDRYCVALLEHVDSVRIFVTRDVTKDQITSNVSRGRGNVYAQMGQVREWLIEQDHRVRKETDQDEAEEVG